MSTDEIAGTLNAPLIVHLCHFNSIRDQFARSVKENDFCQFIEIKIAHFTSRTLKNVSSLFVF